jgi:hypothetical protein
MNTLSLDIVREILSYTSTKIDARYLQYDRIVKLFKEELFPLVIINASLNNLVYLFHQYPHYKNTCTILLDGSTSQQAKKTFYKQSLPKQGKWIIRAKQEHIDMLLAHSQFLDNSHTIHVNIVKENALHVCTIIKCIPELQKTNRVTFEALPYLNIDNDKNQFTDIVHLMKEYTISFQDANMNLVQEQLKRATAIKSLVINDLQTPQQVDLLYLIFKTHVFAKLTNLKIHKTLGTLNTLKHAKMPQDMAHYSNMLLLVCSKHRTLKHLALENCHIPHDYNLQEPLKYIHTIHLKNVDITHEQRIMLIKLVPREYREEKLCTNGWHVVQCDAVLKDKVITYDHNLKQALKETKAKIFLNAIISPVNSIDELDVLNIINLKHVLLHYRMKLPCHGKEEGALSRISQIQEALSEFHKILCITQQNAQSKSRTAKQRIDYGNFYFEMNDNTQGVSSIVKSIFDYYQEQKEHFSFLISTRWHDE